MGDELRKHPRFRVALRAHLALPTGPVAASTVGVSRTGMSVRLSPAPAIGEEVPVTLELPNGTTVDARARCRSHLPGCLVGMSLSFTGDGQAYWDSFVDEEESTGSLWRMIGRVARAPNDVNAPRGITEGDVRFHTVGENGEAYRIAFHKQPSELGEDSDLARDIPGFRMQARRLVYRVLNEPMQLRLDEGSRVLSVRVCELVRGGFAFVQPADGDTPTGVVSLVVGELMVAKKNGASVYPHFTDDELEQIACDTFRRELSRPVFTTPPRGVKAPRAPAPVSLPPMPLPKYTEGYDAVRFAQAASEDVQVRKYGDRDIYFHPSVWAKVVLPGAGELMGPTLQDAGRVCVLALVGPGAPRVVKLDEQAHVKLLKPPK